jgi:pimeloyl-ACP methyl ester carboxylesterase
MGDLVEPAVLPAAPGYWEPSPGADDHHARFPKERRVVVSDGTPIVYALRRPPPAAPRRPAMVFANSWSCSDIYWAEVVPRLVAAGHLCLVPDTRGHGASGLPRPPGRGGRNLRAGDLSIARQALDLVEVLDDAGVDEAIVVGHSLGTHTALETFRVGRPRVAGLVLIVGSCEDPLTSIVRAPFVGALFPVGRALMTTLPEVVRPVWWTIGNKRTGFVSARLAGAAGPKATADGFHPYLLHLAEADPAVLFRAMDAIRHHSAGDLLPRIDVPVLVLGARRDHFTPPRCSERLFERMPTAEIQWFDEAGHTLPIEEPDGVVAAIEEWSERRVASAVCLETV